MKATSIGLILFISLLFVANSYDARGETLKSPPLPAIKNRCLVLAIPPGWKIVQQDDPYRWQTASFNFDIVHPHKKTVGIEILNYDTVRAQMHDDLTGRPFTTSTGLRGVIHRLSFAPGQTDWYFAIPYRMTGEVLIVRLVGLAGTSKAQRTFAYHIFKPIRFVMESSPK